MVRPTRELGFFFHWSLAMDGPRCTDSSEGLNVMIPERTLEAVIRNKIPSRGAKAIRGFVFTFKQRLSF